jgi:hypothetical protein
MGLASKACKFMAINLSGVQIDNLGFMLEQYQTLAGQAREILTGYKIDWRKYRHLIMK